MNFSGVHFYFGYLFHLDLLKVSPQSNSAYSPVAPPGTVNVSIAFLDYDIQFGFAFKYNAVDKSKKKQ